MKKKENGDRGENLALERLRLLGYKALLKPRNNPVFDIECEGYGGSKFTVQVKTSTERGLQAWAGLKAVDGQLREDLYFVFVRRWYPDTEAPEFFVLTHRELKEAWDQMPLTKPNGTPYKRTGHLAWKHLVSHLDRWDKLPQKLDHEALRVQATS